MKRIFSLLVIGLLVMGVVMAWAGNEAPKDVAKNGQMEEQGEAKANKILNAWIRQKAEQGDVHAQRGLAMRYEIGKDVPRNYAEAAKWYLKAAEQGDWLAQVQIGFYYSEGRGVPRDHAKAVKWYLKAAEQDSGLAQFNLGIMYAEGQGTPQNYVKAHMWFNLAAAKGDAGAGHNRDLLAAKMTKAQIAEAQRLAAEWKPKKSVKGK